MKVSYKGFDLEVKREQAMGGWEQLYFTAVRKSDRWFFIDGFEDSGETIRDKIKQLKESVDDYLQNPKDYEEND